MLRATAFRSGKEDRFLEVRNCLRSVNTTYAQCSYSALKDQSKTLERYQVEIVAV